MTDEQTFSMYDVRQRHLMRVLRPLTIITNKYINFIVYTSQILSI